MTMQGRDVATRPSMDDGDGEIVSVLPMLALAFVRRAAGEDAVAEVLRRAGVSPDHPGLQNQEEWVSFALASAIAAAAGEVCGDESFGRRIGEEYFLDHLRHGATNFIIAEGDLPKAFELSVSFATRMVVARQLQVVEVGAHSLVVESRSTQDGVLERWFCEVCIGYWSRIPELFGVTGSVVERRCRGRGADACEFLVQWDEAEAAGKTDLSRGKVDEAFGRFEDFQALAAELVLAEDVPAVLDHVVRRARLAVMAPKVLITVSCVDGTPPLLASVGMSEAEAEAASAALWSGQSIASAGAVFTAAIASPHRHYGYVAALLAPGAGQIETDERLLEAYAGHATAAIERAVSMEDAQRSHQTATGLLDLARSLAVASTVDDVCGRVADALPAVVGCDLGSVWLWDATTLRLRLQRCTGTAPPAALRELRASDFVSVKALAIDPHPVTISLTESQNPAFRALLEDWGVQEAYAAPIELRGEFLGLVCAASTTAVPPGAARDVLLDRLGALASHASTAIDSSLLVEQIRHQSTHDPLTGLPNRVLAESEAGEALASAATAGEQVGFLFVDLDRFKNVNDTLGHSAGDDLIVQVASRLRASVRESDVVARLGGDEFLVMLRALHDAGQAVTVAESLIEAIRAPFQVAGRTLYISSSVGVATFPCDGEDFATLMSHADAAMYQAKALGRSTYAVHADDVTGERQHRLQLESELHLAVEQDQLVVLYQPQVELLTGRVVGVEALVRWDHPRLGRLEPEAFLAIAEESGVIVDIDRWVRRTALEQALRWTRSGTPLRTAINLSTRELRKPELADEISALITEIGLPPALVELEITDRVVMSSEDFPLAMAKLRAIGVRLVIDDFGTGNSVFSRLQHCPIDVLKIDRSFINELRAPGADARLVHALISMAHALGLTVVAVGIETDTQRAILRGYGCELGQGNLFSTPVSADAINALLLDGLLALDGIRTSESAAL